MDKKRFDEYFKKLTERRTKEADVIMDDSAFAGVKKSVVEKYSDKAHLLSLVCKDYPMILKGVLYSEALLWKVWKRVEAISLAVRYCDDCKVQVKEERNEKQKQYVKDRMAKLGLVNISVYKTDRDIIKAIAKKENITVAEVIKRHFANTSNNNVDADWQL